MLGNPKRAGLLALAVEEGDTAGVVRLLEPAFPAHALLDIAVRLVPDDVDDVRVVFERQGMRWMTDVGDEIGRSLYRRGSYEGEELNGLLAFNAVARPQSQCPVVVDLGANVGTTSLPLAALGYKVLAVEPVPATFEMLQTNVRANGLEDRVLCVQAAISETLSDSVEMAITSGSGQSEVLASEPPSFLQFGFRLRDRVRVPAAGLMNILRDAQIPPSDVSFVWCDTQGSEAAVVASGAPLWRAGVPFYAEVSPRAVAIQGSTTRYLDLVEQSFSRFVTRDELVGNGSSARVTDIAKFTEFFSSIRDYSDALFLP